MFKHIFYSFVFLSVQFLGTASFAGSIGEILIQNGGRVKAFDSFARESLLITHGKDSFMNKDPANVVFTWFLAPAEWAQTDFIRVDHKGLKEKLKFDPGQKYFSPEKLLSNPAIFSFFQTVRTKNKSEDDLNALEQAVQKIENSISLFKAISTGEILNFYPPNSGEAWLNVNQFEDPEVKNKFKSLVTQFMENLGPKKTPLTQAGLNKQIQLWTSHLAGNLTVTLPPENKVKAELFYNQNRPLKWAWIVYFLAALLLLLAWIFNNTKFYYSGWVFLVLAFLIHSLGFILRVWISGRPPVSNMYETVIWVPWGAVLFGMGIEYFYRNRVVLFGSAVSAVLMLILADSAPVTLDPTIQPLMSVLRSNFWLTTHVLTVTISYSAFLLAMVLGDINLFLFFKEKKNLKQIKEINLSIYRALQIGVFLLAVGIILGGIWADYSWGRFWGWDPKESGALVAVLGYLALLHARLVGWIAHFGMTAGAVLGFSLVVFAWYGVNFVFGKGLHAYAFGLGGGEYVAAFVLLHYIAVSIVALYRMKAQKK